MSGTVRVSAVAILRDAPTGPEVLTVRKHGTSLYQYPGGKPEPGESACEAALREVAEETGLGLVGDSLSPVGTFTAPAANEPGFSVTADLFLLAGRRGSGTPVPDVAAEIADARWVPLAAAPDGEQDAALAPLMAVTFPAIVGMS